MAAVGRASAVLRAPGAGPAPGARTAGRTVVVAVPPAELRTCVVRTAEAVTASSTTPAPPPCSIPPRFAGQDLSRLPDRDKVIALTFDGGANADGVPSIRATLRTMEVKATFFLTGSFVKAFPAKSARLAARDVVGNHTMTHPDLTTLTDAQITSQVRGART